MICPKCKQGLIESINYKRVLFRGYFKVYNLFCGCCDYNKVMMIKISKEDYFNALEVRTLNAQNTKILSTDKTYNQNYKKGIIKPITQ